MLLPKCWIYTIFALFAIVGGLLAPERGHADCKVAVVAKLPITMEGLRPLIAAKVNGTDATFLIDSGAFYSQITPGSATEYHLKLESAPFGMRGEGVGGSYQLSIAKVKKFEIIGQTIPNIEFLVGGSELGNQGIGVIGENILGFIDAEYDLAQGVIRLMKPYDCSNKGFAYWDTANTYSVISIDTHDGPLFKKIVGTAYVNGVKISAAFDTGAPTSVVTRRAAKRAGIDITDAGVVDAGYSGGFGKHSVKTWIAPVASFKIGDEDIRNTHLRISQSLVDLPGAPDMLLGADFFLSHHIYVANSQHKLYFTYNGGAVFNLKVNTTQSADGAVTAEIKTGPATQPKDADDFARRGSALAARQQFGEAITVLTQAITLVPTEYKYPLARAAAYIGNSQPFLAMADLDTALKLKPGDIQVLMTRAQLRLTGRDNAGVMADLAAADTVMGKESDLHFGMAVMYEQLKALPESIAQMDLWIKAHPDDHKRGSALNSRCWARALLGKQLDLALADCNTALRETSKSAAVLDSRGLVYLRQGNFDKAIDDYNAALAQHPKLAWSLYGRGLAKLHKGLVAEANADIAAATGLNDKLPAEAKSYGITE